MFLIWSTVSNYCRSRNVHLRRNFSSPRHICDWHHIAAAREIPRATPRRISYPPPWRCVSIHADYVSMPAWRPAQSPPRGSSPSWRRLPCARPLSHFFQPVSWQLSVRDIASSSLSTYCPECVCTPPHDRCSRRTLPIVGVEGSTLPPVSAGTHTLTSRINFADSRKMQIEYSFETGQGIRQNRKRCT